MPDDVTSLRQVIASQYGGNAQTYAEVEHKTFREMGCDGKIELLRALVEGGLDMATLSPPVHSGAFRCSIEKKQTEATLLLMTPGIITWWEDRCAGVYGCWMPLRLAIQQDDYRTVRRMLESGVHYFWEHKDYLPLTREENLVLAAETARKDAKDESQRAFVDAGFGHLLAASQDKAKLSYIKQRLKAAKGKRGNGGGGMLMGLLGGAVGFASGGATAAGTALAGSYALLDSGLSEDERTTTPNLKPLPLETGRRSLGFSYLPSVGDTPGVKVENVLEDTLSARAGLMQGDIVTHIDGVATTSRAEIYVATHRVLDKEMFVVRYVRAGKAQEASFGSSTASVAQIGAEVAPAVEAGSPASGSAQVLAELERLAELRDRDLLSEEEFQALKARILGID